MVRRLYVTSGSEDAPRSLAGAWNVSREVSGVASHHVRTTAEATAGNDVTHGDDQTVRPAFAV